MKKIKTIFLVILFFLFVFTNIQYINTNKKIDFSCANTNKNVENDINNNRIYTFLYNNKVYKFNSSEFIDFEKISRIQKVFLEDEENFSTNFERILQFGLTKREIINYFCPEIEKIKNKLCKGIDCSPEENYVQVIKNTCKLNYIYGQRGVYLNQDEFYDKIFNEIKRNAKEIKINISVDYYNDENDIKNDFKEKGSFLTNFSSSSPERKNNIKVALSKFDGLVLEQGEVLSFNAVTGERDEKSGYMPAKIISNGTFVEGYGGGVCQVSTTLYNACLLAGLDIIEVHNHSLPVSYVEPSFDAMVNSGSSDLVIRNNTDGKIIITTSYNNDYCKVKIFGKKNRYKITRYSEKYKIIPSQNDIVDTDFKKYGELNLELGEEKRLSYSKDGFYSNGYLKYFDENGVLVETKKIRENKYNATKGIIVKREV